MSTGTTATRPGGGRGTTTPAGPGTGLLPAAATTIAVGASLGAATSWGQALLPSATSSLANSAGGWSLVAFGLVWWTRSRPAAGALLGLLAFGALHVGYALASSARGYTWSLAPTNFWVAAAFVAGPLVGIGAAWARGRTDALAAVGVAGLAGLLAGEGIYGLTVLAATTSPVYWSASIVTGAVFLAVMASRQLRGAAAVLVAVVGTPVTAMCLLGAYGVLNGSI